MKYNVGGIVLDDKNLLVVRKKNTREECILPGGKRIDNEDDFDTLKREFLEELNVTIKSFNFFGSYNHMEIFSDKMFHMEAYFVEFDGLLKCDNEIKEFLWIDRNYKENGILVSHMLEDNIIPELIKRGLF